jgi:hypothetical protein
VLGTYGSEIILTASDGATFDQFGTSVSLSSDGNTLAVGAPGDDESPYVNSGSAYIFTYSGTWAQQQKLIEGSSVTASSYGKDVKVSSDGLKLVVARSSVSAAGTDSVFIYQYSGGTWTLSAEKEAPLQNVYFGYAIALSGSGSNLLVGVPLSGTEEGGSVDAEGSMYYYPV